MVTANEQARMHLISPAFLTQNSKPIVTIDMPWLQRQCYELARQMELRTPQIDWGYGNPLCWPNQSCQSLSRRWANIEKAGYRIRIHHQALQDLDSQGLLFVIAHLISQLNNNDEEWVHDLRALSQLGEVQVPLVEETAIAIAMQPSARQKALNFAFGKYVIEQGFNFAAEREAERYELPFMIQAPKVRRYPY